MNPATQELALSVDLGEAADIPLVQAHYGADAGLAAALRFAHEIFPVAPCAPCGWEILKHRGHRGAQNNWEA